MTPRGNGNRRYDGPNANLGTRSRCREYDHFANECPSVRTNDSDGYESDRAALQLMTTEAEIHDNVDTTRLNEEAVYLNLLRVRMLPPHSCLKQRNVDLSDLTTKLLIYLTEEDV